MFSSGAQMLLPQKDTVLVHHHAHVKLSIAVIPSFGANLVYLFGGYQPNGRFSDGMQAILSSWIPSAEYSTERGPTRVNSTSKRVDFEGKYTADIFMPYVLL